MYYQHLSGPTLKNGGSKHGLQALEERDEIPLFLRA